MFGNSGREKRFSQLTTKALKHLNDQPDYRSKDLDEDKLDAVLHRASFAAVSEILDGLKGELFGILQGNAEDKKAEVVDAFRLGRLAIDRLVGVTEIKKGTAGWMTYAVGGLEPPKPRTQTKETEQDLSWVGELGKHEDSPESVAYAGTEPGKSLSKELEIELGRKPFIWELNAAKVQRKVIE